MKILVWLGLVGLVMLAVPGARGQNPQSDEQFARSKPTIGDLLPDLKVYNPEGKEVATSSLRGHYTVLTFGCLT